MFQSVENLVKNFLINLEFDWSLVNLPVILATSIVALISTYVIWRNYKKRKPNSILKKSNQIFNYCLFQLESLYKNRFKKKRCKNS